MELAFASLQQLCAPMLDRLERAPGAATSGPGDRVRAERRRGPGPVSRRAGGVEPVLGGGRRASAPVCRRRRAVARSGVGADAGVRGPSPAGGAGRDRVRRARAGRGALSMCPSWRCAACATPTPRALLASAVVFRLDERVRDRIIAETRGNPLALLELPRGLTATELAGGFGMLGAHALRGRIEESYVRRLEALPEDARLLLLVAAAEPVGDPLLLLRASERLGISVSAVDAATDGLLDDRGARDLPPSAGALGGVPVRRREGAPSGASGVGGGDRSRRRPGSPRMASGRGGGGPRRGRRPRAGALRGSGAGARRPRCRGRVPAARGRADRRPGAPSRQGARSRGGQPWGRARSTWHAGCWRRLRSARSTSSSAPAWTCFAPRPPTPRAAAAMLRALLLRAAKTLEPLDPQLARETYLDAWSSALFAGRLASAVGLHEVSREASAARTPAERPASVRSAAGGVLARLHGGPLRRGAGAPAGGDRLRGQRRLDRGGPALGLARDRGRGDGVGLRDLSRGCHARGRASPATPGR